MVKVKIHFSTTRTHLVGFDMLATECGSCLDIFVKSLLLPAVLISNGHIGIANDSFISFMDTSADTLVGQIPATIFPGFGLEGLVPHAIQEKRAHTIEREMVIATRRALLSIQVIPASANMAIMTITDLAPLRQGQLAFLQQLRRKETDHFWIVDESYTIIFSSVADPAATFGVALGDSLFPALTESGKADALKMFQLAKIDPGKVIETTLTLANQPHPIYVGAMFLHDPLRIGRYLLAVGSEARRGDDAVDRLCEAYGAVNDADLAIKAGKQKSAISQARRKGLSPLWAYEALRATGISGDWIMTGRGSKIFMV